MVQRIVGIDLGSYSVKVLALEARGKGAFDVVAYHEALLPAAADAAVPSAESLSERQAVALEELKRRGALEGDVFVTGLPGDAAVVRTLKFPFSDRQKIAAALPFTLEGEISIDLDEIVWSWLVLENDRPGRKKGETEVLVAFARKEAVQEVLNLLAAHGIDPRHVEFDALALDDLWDSVFKSLHATDAGPTELRTPGGTVIEAGEGAPESAVAIVDIGHRRTSVCVLAGGRVVSAQTLLHGGADATRSLAREIGLSLEEAERGKRKEAFIEVAGAVAQFPEQQQISEVLKRAYAPIVRRLRQVFQAAISTPRVRVVKVVLTGGGSRVLNLDRYLSEQLNVKVVRGKDIGLALRGKIPEGEDAAAGVPEAAMAFAYALSALAGPRTKARIDFRVGEYAWKGDFDFVREKGRALAGWAAVLLVLFAASSGAQLYLLSRQEAEVGEKQLELCEQILGKKVDSYNVCLSLIQERTTGTASFKVPEVSAADVFLEISRRLPSATDVKRKITELDITSERVRMKGTTDSYESIDKIVERLQGGRCFSLVEKGKLRSINADSVELNVTITLDCDAAPGDGTAPVGVAGPTTSPVPTPTSSAPPERITTQPSRPADEGSRSAPVAAEDVSPPRGSESPDDRRARLQKLREEREARRQNLMDSPAIRPNLRDRFQKPGLRERLDATAPYGPARGPAVPKDAVPEVPAGDE